MGQSVTQPRDPTAETRAGVNSGYESTDKNDPAHCLQHSGCEYG